MGKSNMAADPSVVELPSEIDLSNQQAILERIGSVLKTEKKDLILDFSHVDYMDSSGIQLILGAIALCDQYEVRLLGVVASEAVAKITRISGIDRIVNIVGDGEVLQSLLRR